MESIEVLCWLKNATEWYYPTKKVYLNHYKHIELLKKTYFGDLFYAWDDDKLNGRLFKGTWNHSERMIEN